MGDAEKSLRDMLAADARRRARAVKASAVPPPASREPAVSLDLRLRFVHVLPRLTRPLFAALRAELAVYGYTLSPLHPAHDLSRPRLQTELVRTAPEQPAHYAPLIFELDPPAAIVRVQVRQSGGRVVPGLAEHAFNLNAEPDLAALDGMLRDYVRCILDTQPVAPA
jgi:hypothetical protein